MVSAPSSFANAPPGVRRTSWRSAKMTSRSGWISPFSSRGMRWFMRPGSSRISGCSEPPKATFISCKPRQMPNSGTPRATQASISASATRRDAVVGLVARVLGLAETARMDIGARAGQHDAVDGIEQRADVGDLRRAGKHQRQRAGGFGDRAQIALADPLRGEFASRRMGAADHADDGSFRCHLAASTGFLTCPIKERDYSAVQWFCYTIIQVYAALADFLTAMRWPRRTGQRLPFFDFDLRAA